MQIRLGATAFGTDGKLGDIHGFFLDPKSRRAEQITIKPALGEAHVVNLARVVREENGQVYLDVDKTAFEAAPRFDARAYRAPGANTEIEPPSTRTVGSILNLEMQPGLIGRTGEGLPAPRESGAPEYTPLDARLPVVSLDMDIVDANGEKVGKVGAFAVESVTGTPELLTVHQGALFGHEVNLPLDWVGDIRADGIMLKVKKEEIKGE